MLKFEHTIPCSLTERCSLGLRIPFYLHPWERQKSFPQHQLHSSRKKTSNWCKRSAAISAPFARGFRLSSKPAPLLLGGLQIRLFVQYQIDLTRSLNAFEVFRFIWTLQAWERFYNVASQREILESVWRKQCLDQFWLSQAIFRLVFRKPRAWWRWAPRQSVRLFGHGADAQPDD